MNKFQATKADVSKIVQHASREGLWVGHCWLQEAHGLFPAVVVEGMVQEPCTAPFDAKVPEGRDLRVVRYGDRYEVEVVTELGEIFVDVFLPRAA
jgi:hypothetical protein